MSHVPSQMTKTGMNKNVRHKRRVLQGAASVPCIMNSQHPLYALGPSTDKMEDCAYQHKRQYHGCRYGEFAQNMIRKLRSEYSTRGNLVTKGVPFRLPIFFDVVDRLCACCDVVSIVENDKITMVCGCTYRQRMRRTPCLIISICCCRNVCVRCSS